MEITTYHVIDWTEILHSQEVRRWGYKVWAPREDRRLQAGFIIWAGEGGPPKVVESAAHLKEFLEKEGLDPDETYIQFDETLNFRRKV